MDQNDDLTLSLSMKYYISQKVGIKWKRLESVDNTDFANKCMAVFAESSKYEELKWKQIKDALMEIGLDNVVSGFESTYLRNIMYT